VLHYMYVNLSRFSVSFCARGSWVQVRRCVGVGVRQCTGVVGRGRGFSVRCSVTSVGSGFVFVFGFQITKGRDPAHHPAPDPNVRYSDWLIALIFELLHT
jgi:hypothetical protein